MENETIIKALSYKSESLFVLENASVVRTISMKGKESAELFSVPLSLTGTERRDSSTLLVGPNYIAVGTPLSQGSWLAVFDVKNNKLSCFHAFEWPASLLRATMGGEIVYCADEAHKIIGICCKTGEEVWRSEEELTARRLIIGSNHLIGGTTFGGFTIWGPKSIKAGLDASNAHEK